MIFRSTADLPHLVKKLAVARKRGYAIDDGEVHPGVYGIAMTIPPRAPGESTLAIGVSLVESGGETVSRDAVIAELREIADQLANPTMTGA